MFVSSLITEMYRKYYLTYDVFLYMLWLFLILGDEYAWKMSTLLIFDFCLSQFKWIVKSSCMDQKS